MTTPDEVGVGVLVGVEVIVGVKLVEGVGVFVVVGVGVGVGQTLPGRSLIQSAQSVS